MNETFYVIAFLMYVILNVAYMIYLTIKYKKKNGGKPALKDTINYISSIVSISAVFVVVFLMLKSKFSL